MARKKSKRQTVSVLRWAVGAAAAVLLACSVLYAVFDGGYLFREPEAEEEIAGIEVHTDYISPDSPARPGQTRTVETIVIHETDNTRAEATAQAHNEYLHENCWKELKSWHYTVDENEIWHHLPDNEVGYHAGDSSRGAGNLHGIGVELCVNAGGDFEKTMRNAAQLTAFLLRRYGLSVEDVKKHQDFSGKQCPQTLIQTGRWEEFLQLVQDAAAEQDSQAAAEAAAQAGSAGQE